MAYLWGISDTHFCHLNIAKYADRPDDWEKQLLTNWKQLVAEDDWVLHCGDIAFGREAALSAITYIMDDLPGNVILAWGNHDRKHSQRKWLEIVGIRAILKQHLSYCDLGNYRIIYLKEEPYRASPEHGKKLLYVSHKPILEQRATPYYYGHIHEKTIECAGRNLCVEHTGYAPIKIGEIKWAKNEELHKTGLLS